MASPRSRKASLQGQVEKRGSNIAQSASTADLVSALHKGRDIALAGKIPLVSFDEFDSTTAEGKLGWLKYFLAPEEVEILAEMEHDRWNAERLLAGWSLGPHDPERKISPYLVGWSDLPDDVKEYDRQAVSGMAEFLAEAGFEIYRLR